MDKTTWQRVKLGEIGKITTGKTPSQNNPQDWGDETLFITPSDYKNYYKYAKNSIRKISKEGKTRFKNIILPKNSILVTCIGSDMGKVVINYKECLTNQQINSITPNAKVLYNFLYYHMVFLYPVLKNFGLSGTAIPILNKSDFENIEISLPPLETQHKIAEILSSLDDKIDLLHRQNKTLESLSFTLFRHTFIDNPNRNAWEIGKLGDYVKIELGGTPNTAKSEYWGGDIAWINSGEINKFRIIKPTKTITKLGFEKSNTKLLPKGSVVIAITGATLGQVSLLEIDSCANQSVVGVIPNDDFSSEFLYLWIKFNIDKIILNQTGGAQQHINKNDIANYPIIKPSKEFLANINLKIYFNKISHNMKEIQNLESLRDIMLPKLLSGEMEV